MNLSILCGVPSCLLACPNPGTGGENLHEVYSHGADFYTGIVSFSTLEFTLGKGGPEMAEEGKSGGFGGYSYPKYNAELQKQVFRC